jgi:two-component system nitrate/nitrite response regulator NarL
VVDDHHLFRTGIRALLEEEGFEVADAASGEAALRRLDGFAPDVVVMDLNMPGMSGIEATRRIAAARPGTAVIILSIAGEGDGVLDALRAGATGYLLKDARLEEIAAGIRAAADGHSAIALPLASTLVRDIRASGERRGPERAALPVALSDRERQILRLLASGCDNGAIAKRLYLSRSTAKTHVSRLLEKLGVNNRVQAATYAVRHGLTDADDSGSTRPVGGHEPAHQLTHRREA